MIGFGTDAGRRIFALPPGADFLGGLAAGLEARLAGAPPEAWARVEIWLNTRRAARGLAERMAAGPARLLPRIRVIADLADDPLALPAALPPAVSPLRRRLDLARLVRGLIDAEPDLAAPSAAFELAESLAGLLDEMAGEGIDPAALARLDAGTHARHWERGLAFLRIAARYAAGGPPPPGEGRLRGAVEALAAAWQVSPPGHPVIVAGSTGSRAPSRALMAAVARLPQGAVVLPGLDPALPPDVWRRLADAPDHPQAGFAALAGALGFDPVEVPAWSAAAAAPVPERNALLGLALRPAPVTDAWRREGAALVPGLAAAAAGLTLIEAANPRGEAEAVALVLREAAETGRRAALVTPDRTLARRVAAALARWGIVPDDSAGRPLALTPPGILLSLVAGIEPGRLEAERLLVLLKHPLTASAPGARSRHRRAAALLERRPLAGHPPLVDWQGLAGDCEDTGWLGWLKATLEAPLPAGEAPLAAFVAAHRSAAEALAAGPEGGAGHGLWEKAAGEAARAVLDGLEAEAEAGDLLAPADYRALLAGLLAARDVPEEAVIPHGSVAIWGTLEARVQSADRVVLAGLVEGTWPRLPPPDPWLSRPLRAALGLPAPERRIGLAAHDFALAAGAPEVVLARALRDAEAPTVASRWLLRLENLMRGLGPEGAAALDAARARGAAWTGLAARLAAPERKVPPSSRPAPAPPAEARPAHLSVSDVQTLIRDPYAIYARHVLRLRPLDPPGREADALARGTALHGVLEAFLYGGGPLPPDAEARFCETARRVLAATPWPAARAIWTARLERVAAWFIATEAERRRRAAPFAREVKGRMTLPATGIELRATADRIDRAADGGFAVYDYKSGGVPSENEARAFHLQLPLEAAILAAGGFDGVPPGRARHLELIGLKGETRPLDADAADEVLARLDGLVAHYLDPSNGFEARLRPQRITFGGDYDHLARLGEWGDGDAPQVETVP